MNIAQGSLEETRYYLVLARDPGYGDNEKLDTLAMEVSKVLNAYMESTRKNHR